MTTCSDIPKSRAEEVRPRALRADGNYFFAPVGRIQGSYLRGLKSFALQDRSSFEAIRKRYDVELESLEDSQYFIPCESVSELLEEFSYRLNDPLFGINLALYQSPNVFGCLSVLARSCANLRDSLETLARYVPLVNSPEGHLELVTTREVAELRWKATSSLDCGPQVELHCLQLFMKILRDLGGPKFAPISAGLPCHVGDQDRDMIENALGCRFVGRASRKSITFPLGLLDRPLEWSDRVVHELLGSYLDQALTRIETPLKERVEALIRFTLPAGDCSIQKCASRLEMSVRTLQKHLASQALSFSDLVEDQRQQLAKVALARGDEDLDAIAVALGYSEQTSFGRAFKRWTGSTPDRFRRLSSGHE